MERIDVKRLRIGIEGIVQGVGFRPFVYRLALSCGLCGWVRNLSGGVLIEVQGEAGQVELFSRRLPDEIPPLALVSSIREEEIPPVAEEPFRILESAPGEAAVRISPDVDVCPDCLAELSDPADRRYRYPFINCTNCGPRFTIITGIPYDRPLTTMAPFAMCDACRSEYDNPLDRRFHAQPNACPVCGPRVRLVGRDGGEVEGDPVDTAAALLKQGCIVAIKATGGYHLAVDALNGDAVRELRRRKLRDEKPFAVMAPGMEEVARCVVFSDTEARLLCGPERPVVLMAVRSDSPVAAEVAPGNGWLGMMLPSTPLHHLLLRDRFTAVVMTSGNLSDEPTIHHDAEALERLSRIADYFLLHDREIHVRADDSVIRVFDGNPLFMRRSRGYVPRAVRLPAAQPAVLATGGELKSTLCLTSGSEGVMSQHIGDLKNADTMGALRQAADHLTGILGVRPELIAHDLHPDYQSTIFALERDDLPRVAVQHHHAHMASCMAENRLEGEAIGVIFDGTGYGLDGTIWGGEFLVGGYDDFRRAGWFSPVPMPGGDAAAREPFRMALSWLYRSCGDRLFDLALPCCAEVKEAERPLFLRMLERGINSPPTSSCGRLFDAVAALLGLRQRITYEGQAAIELEGLAESSEPVTTYPWEMRETPTGRELDFSPLVREIAEDVLRGGDKGRIARSFHLSLANAAATMCDTIREETGLSRVVLSGGVFQNRLLSADLRPLLVERGFEVFVHRLVPPNDGGLALGQAVIAGRRTICA